VMIAANFSIDDKIGSKNESSIVQKPQPQISAQPINAAPAAAPNRAVTGDSSSSEERLGHDMVLDQTYVKQHNVPWSQVENEKKNCPIWLKITSGCCAVVAAGAGFIIDGLVKNESNKCSNITAQYSNSGSNNAYATYRLDYIDHYNSAKRDCLIRNVLYSVGGLFAAGFAISFTF